MFQHIAAAVAFSPRCDALLSEAFRLKTLFGSELSLIHVGEKTPEAERTMEEKLQAVGHSAHEVHIIWERGNPAKRILAFCRNEKIDLLLAGALKKEKLYEYYIGSVARKILRKAPCSVLMITAPSVQSNPVKRIVIHAENSPYVKRSIQAGLYIARKQKAEIVHIVRELKLYGMTMAKELTEQEYMETKKELVNTELEKINALLEGEDTEGFRINAKVVSGKSGYEISKFTEKVGADLLVTGAPKNKYGLFDRMFPHDLEVLFANLPSNLLVVH